MTVDLAPVLKGIDAIGGGLSGTSKDVEALKGQVAELKHLQLCTLAALQLIFGQNTSLAQWAQGAGFDPFKGNVNDFIKFLGNALPR